MPRWQTYEVNFSDEYDSKERTSQVKFESDQEMAGDSPNLTAARYARRSASPVSSASTAGTSSSSAYSGGEVGTMKRKEVVQISSATISNKKDANSTRHPSFFTAVCGWVCACIFGTVSLTFLLLIYLLPTEGIFPVGVQLYQKSDIPNIRQGSLKIYPGFNSSRFEHTISLDPLDALPNREEILDVVKSYPVHTGNKLPPPPHIHCWLENPTRDHPCFFHEGWLGDLCSENDSYGYNTASPYINPCFLLRIEESGSWAPESLRPEYVGDSWRHEYDPAFLGVGCRPKEGDRSGVTIEKFPNKGFSVLYFPMNNFSPDLYLTPAVMVQVKGVPRDINVTIECWIRAHNKQLLTDSGNIIINFVHRGSGIQSKSSKITSSSSTTSAIVNTPRLVHETHNTNTISTIPLMTSTSSTENYNNSSANFSAVNYNNSNTNFSVVMVDSNESLDYTYEDDDGGMPPS